MNLILQRKGIRIFEKGIIILAVVLLLAGAVGKGIFENALVEEGSLEGERFLKDAGAALGLQAIATAAVPIFVHILFEEIRKDENKYKLLLELLMFSILSEIPYDLVFFGKLFDFKGQNFFFGLFVALSAVILLEKYNSQSFKNKALRVVIVLSAFTWTMLLRAENGLLLMGLTAVYFGMREREKFRPFALAAVISAFSMVYPLYMPAPLGLVIVHFYEGTNKKLPKHILAIYPLMLLSVYMIALIV